MTAASPDVDAPVLEAPVPYPNKYMYDAFAGYEGERLLKSILRKILPLALYRTWEILAERQAPGNDCFLSIASISETAERVERTIRLNIHELEARLLLVLRPEQKVLRQADGSHKLKMVVVKDFSGLYALALEYWHWTLSDDYIEPERDFAAVIQDNEALTRKLLRFDNYRRILLHKLPGPKAREREEHRWYTEYAAQAHNGACSTPSQPNAAGDAEEVQSQKTSTDRKQYLQKQLQTDMQKDSEERVITSDQKNPLQRDSSDSEGPSERRGGDDYTKPNGQPSSEQERRESRDELTTLAKTNPTNPSSPPAVERAAEQSARREQAELDVRAQAFVKRAMATYQGMSSKAARRSRALPAAASHPLVSAFLREISLPFCDQNVKGSLTRVQRVVAQVALPEKALVACLVKAYLVAKEVAHVRPEHRHAEGENRMPLFCTMFARFAEQYAKGAFHYEDASLLRDIAEDDRLQLFVVEQQLEEVLLGVVMEEEGEALEAQTEEQPVQAEQEYALVVPAENQDAANESVQEAQLSEEEPPAWVDTLDPHTGWSNWSGADYWADRLREHYPYGRNTYKYEVLPLCCEGEPTGKWAFVFYRHGEKHQHWAVYVTPDQVKVHLERTETAWMASDGVIGHDGVL